MAGTREHIAYVIISSSVGNFCCGCFCLPNESKWAIIELSDRLNKYLMRWLRR